MDSVKIGPHARGTGHPLLWIAGPCVIEGHDFTLRIADRLAEMAQQLKLNLVFKASFDKANRGSANRFAGRASSKLKTANRRGKTQDWTARYHRLA
ncbi:MAG: hypothetical protein U0744_17975 [Gemmataceae bacterium]